ncbi:hypothetical protein MRS44_001358 [Fusarium solani]|uniref:uncharacterized protein n=1 Tax=Fusarium solani TaxID=169388 RepID=UPI0032C48592|nr:hypothetical protein MRS44_001358 [Fusarium solani]
MPIHLQQQQHLRVRDSMLLPRQITLILFLLIPGIKGLAVGSGTNQRGHFRCDERHDRRPTRHVGWLVAAATWTDHSTPRVHRSSAPAHPWLSGPCFPSWSKCLSKWTDVWLLDLRTVTAIFGTYDGPLIPQILTPDPQPLTQGTAIPGISPQTRSPDFLSSSPDSQAIGPHAVELRLCAVSDAAAAEKLLLL